MALIDLAWKIFFENDNEYVLSRIDIDEKLTAQINKNIILSNDYERIEEDLENARAELEFYKDNEAALAKANELKTYWNTKRPKTKWLYPGRPEPGNENNRIKVDPRIFFQTRDNTIPRLGSGSIDERANSCLKYVINKIKYTTDVKSNGEYWQFAYETFRRKKGDCEDGAILLVNMLIRSGIPYWRIRLNAGMVLGGGHAYVTYLRESDNTWYVFDWCYWPTESVGFKKTWKSAEKYFSIWGSWNEKYVFGDLPKDE